MPMIKFDSEKTIEAILYIARGIPSWNSTIYPILKILYFADKRHLQHYGRHITGDQYVAMRNGPVPSGAYDIMKSVRGDGACFDRSHAVNSFSISEGCMVSPLREVDSDLFSDSEIECLNAEIKENGSKRFGELKEKSHDAAFDEANENDFIPLEAIVRSLPNSDALLEHLKNPYPG